MRSDSCRPSISSIWRNCALWNPLAPINLSRKPRYSRVLSVSITSQWDVLTRKIVAIRSREWTAPDNCCSSTNGRWNRSREARSSR
jgi:hypothetical protein